MSENKKQSWRIRMFKMYLKIVAGAFSMIFLFLVCLIIYITVKT